MWWHVLLAAASVLVLLYGALLLGLWRGSRGSGQGVSMREGLRLLPDVIRLVHRLARDRSTPRGVRWRLSMLLAYLACPIDLVPDVVPVLGQLDDVIVAAVVLRSVVRLAGPEALSRHWPGSPDGLRVIQRLTR